MPPTRIKTEATVLRAVEWSETSQILTLFTRQCGKIPALAKGSRRITPGFHPFDGPFQLASFGHLVLICRPAGLAIVTERWLSFSPKRPSHDLPSLYAACFLLELTEILTVVDDPHPDLFLLLLDALRCLETTPAPPLLAHAYAFKLLRLLGFLGELDRCAECGRPVGLRSSHALSRSDATLFCPDCAPTDGTIPLSGAALATAARILIGPLSSLATLRTSPALLDELARFLAAVILHLTGRSMKTLSFLAKGSQG